MRWFLKAYRVRLTSQNLSALYTRWRPLFFQKRRKLRGGRQKRLYAAIFAIYLLAFHALAHAAGEKMEAQASKTADYQQQLQQLDNEIRLLKAELARKNGNAQLASAFLDKIDPNNLSSEDQQRYQDLKHYVQQKLEHQSSLQSPEPFFVDLSRPLVLLPLSGSYQQIGQTLLEGMRAEGLEAEVVDTALFDSPEQLWTFIQYSQPSLIIGPLRPQWSHDLAQFNLNIPMLALSDPKVISTNVRSLAPKLQVRQALLARFLHSLSVHRVLALKSARASSDLDFHQSVQGLPSMTPSIHVQSIQTVKSSMDLAIEKGVNATRSLARIRWLRKTLGRPLVSEVRARRDLEGVVYLGGVDQALQGRPLLNYYHLDQIPFVWMAASIPSVRTIQNRLAVWQQTYAILPALFPLKALMHPAREGDESYKNDQVGTFYALGQTVVQVLHWLADGKDKNKELNIKRIEIKSLPIGKVARLPGDFLLLLPHIIWLDAGTVDELPIEEVLGDL